MKIDPDRTVITDAKDDAARAMLAALQEFAAWRACPPSLHGPGWDAWVNNLDTIARAAIRRAEAAGITVQP